MSSAETGEHRYETAWNAPTSGMIFRIGHENAETARRVRLRGASRGVTEEGQSGASQERREGQSGASQERRPGQDLGAGTARRDANARQQ